MSNFQIVLFKNNIKKKIIKKFIGFNSAENYYNKLISTSQEIFFPTKIENGKECVYEIALIDVNNAQNDAFYKKDEFGRTIKVKLDNEKGTIVKMNIYNKEEKIFDLQENRKISFSFFIEKYLRSNEIMLISSLNNKIVLQKDENFKLFSLKNEIESQRFLDSLQNVFVENKKSNCLLIKNKTFAEKKYLIEILVNAGFDRKTFYSKFTTYPRSK